MTDIQTQKCKPEDQRLFISKNLTCEAPDTKPDTMSSNDCDL